MQSLPAATAAPATTASTASTAATAEDAFMAALITLGRRMRRRLPGDELDFSLVPVLKALVEHGPTRHTQLADLLRLDASTVSRKIRSLEEHGLVTISHDAQDGRARLVAVLPAGQAMLDRLLSRRRDLISDVLAGWPDEDRERLRALLERFNNDLAADAG